MNRYLSQKFRFFSFACIALLVFVHGYNLAVDYLFSFSLVDEPITLTSFTEYFLANGVLRFRIPLLFLISGYIFAWQDRAGSYIDRLRKRFRSLWIPYFFWSAFALLLTYLLQQFPATASIVYAAKVDQMQWNVPYSSMSWGDILFRWILAPPAYQLWFIFVLFLYNAIYPVIRWLVIRIPYVWLPLAAFLWVSVFNYVVEGQGLFFFSLGVWLQKRNVNIEEAPGWFSPSIGWALFLGLNVVRTFMAFEFSSEVFVQELVVHLLYYINIVVGVVTVWYCSDKLVFWCLRKPWFIWMSAFSFFIYGFHIPLQKFLSVWLLDIFSGFSHVRLLAYVLSGFLILAFSMLVGAAVRRLFPSFYRIITGGRGI